MYSCSFLMEIFQRGKDELVYTNTQIKNDILNIML